MMPVAISQVGTVGVKVMGGIGISVSAGFQFAHAVHTQPEAFACFAFTVEEQGIITGGVG